MQLQEIHYPVFLLGSRKPQKVGSRLIYTTVFLEDNGDEHTVTEVIDDKDIPEPTLGERRLRLLINGEKLANIKHAVYFLADIIKLSKGSKVYFIDNNGEYFTLSKTKTALLIFEKITKLILIPTGGSIVEIDNIPGRFKSLYPPSVEEKYAGVLKEGHRYILYGFYKEKLKNTRRKI